MGLHSKWDERKDREEDTNVFIDFSQARRKCAREMQDKETVADDYIDRLFLQACHQSIDVPEGLERHLLNKVDEWDAEEKRRNRTVDFRPWSMWHTGMAAAAVVAVIVGVGIFARYNEAGDEIYFSDRNTFTNTDEAYKATEKALAMFSESIDKGERSMRKLDEKTDMLDEKLSKIVMIIK